MVQPKKATTVKEATELAVSLRMSAIRQLCNVGVELVSRDGDMNITGGKGNEGRGEGGPIDTQTPQYLSLADKKRIGDFCAHHMQQFLTMPGGPLYHYTTGDNFIKIIKSGELWSTQAACLNDTTELIYAIEQFRQSVRARLCTPHDRAIDPVLI